MGAVTAGYFLWGAAIAALLGTGLILLGTKLTCKFTPPFRVAYKASVVAWAVAAMIAAAIDFPFRLLGHPFPLATLILALVVGFSVSASIYGRMLRHPEFGPIGYGRACLVSAIQFAVMTGISAGAYAILRNQAQAVIDAAMRVRG
ncbi:MAG: hypothetical protein C4547_06575 [Phycisphaerales bacterium]|nr:MAG: hypothetical protein C4547_06575 [Phycisphaerales bacterium]